MIKNNQKGQAIIWVVISLGVAFGALMLVNSNKNMKTAETVKVTNTMPTEATTPPETIKTVVSPTPGPVTDEEIDNALKKVNTDAKNIDKSLNDTPIDVMK